MPGVLDIANYAYLTASHERPPHIVTALDVENAADTEQSVKSHLNLVFNLGDVLGYSRLALFVGEYTYKQTCVDFPADLGVPPRVVPCPAAAIVLWQDVPFVLNESRDAIAAAAKKGMAVSGADVASSFHGGDVKLASTPTFRAGVGGVVRFIGDAKLNSTPTTVHICVRFPRTVAGVPVQVRC